MSLRANFLGVNLKSVRNYQNIKETEDYSDLETENEIFINNLISFTYDLSDNIKDKDFVSEDLGQLFQLFYKEYATVGRPLFGFEFVSSPLFRTIQK